MLSTKLRIQNIDKSLIALTVITTLFISVSVSASESDVQIASFNDSSTMVMKKGDAEHDEEIGSTEVRDFDNRIGAFSREDGAMMGAYGDGEYSEEY